jgi:hypothetical protein
MLLSILVLAFVNSAIRPRLMTIAILLIAFPVTHVLGPISMSVGAEAIRLIVDPITFVNVSVGVK